MLSRMNVVIMFANPYEMKDEETKEVRTGLTVEYYIYGDKGEGLKPVAVADNGAAGIRRSKCSMDASMRNKLMFVPGIYDGEFEMTVGSDGKPTLKLVDIDYVGKCNISVDATDAKKSTAADSGK